SDCRSCHEEIYAAWSGSHHAHAHRPVDPQLDAQTFAGRTEVTLHGIEYVVEWKDGRPHFTEKRPGAAPEPYTADFVLGHTPLQQFIVPVGGGRYQAAELAYDP